MLTQSEIDVVAETKREMEQAFRERMLDMFAVAHHASFEATKELFAKIKHKLADDSHGSMNAVLLASACSVFGMETAVETAAAMARFLKIAPNELKPEEMRRRYQVLQRAGRVP